MLTARIGFLITSSLIIQPISTNLVLAADDAGARLTNAQSLKCHFGPATIAKWKDNETNISSAEYDADVQFDSIDLGKSTARIIGKVAAGDVTATISGIGLTFVEAATAVVDTTTVFATYTDNHEFPAVESRHALFGQAMAEQFYGTCKIWQ